jgi:TonB family protein
MKVCGTCGKAFGEEMMFCLDDGTVLTDSSSSTAVTITDEQPTVVRSTAKPPGSSKLIMFVLGGLLIFGFVLITAAVGGGVWYYSSLPERTVAQTEPTATPTSTPAVIDEYYPTPDETLPATSPTTTPRASDEKPTPTPTKTPKTEPSKKPTEETGVDGPDTYNGPVDYQGPVNNGRRRQIPRQISGGVVNGKATYLPQPPYPAAARAMRLSGRVSVQVLIDESGNVVAARAVSGPALLRGASEAAARRAKFSPTNLAGQPVKVSGIVTYNFLP